VGPPQRGDVVVFRYPLDVSQFYVKRLVGLPGDTVRSATARSASTARPFDVRPLADGTAVEDRGQLLVQETTGGGTREVKINPFVQGRLPLNLDDPGLAKHCQVEARRRMEVHGAARAST
jgi:signal peptidase I